MKLCQEAAMKVSAVLMSFRNSTGVESTSVLLVVIGKTLLLAGCWTQGLFFIGHTATEAALVPCFVSLSTGQLLTRNRLHQSEQGRVGMWQVEVSLL